MRLCFLFATKTQSDLDALPEGKVLTPDNGNGLTLRLPGAEYPESDLLLRDQGKHTFDGASWCVWLVLPCSILDPLMQGARAQRLIKRASINKPASVSGPWSLKEFEERYPTVADLILYPRTVDKNGKDAGKVPGAQLQPSLAIAGDAPEELSKADYRPTDADAIADKEPAPGTIRAGVKTP